MKPVAIGFLTLLVSMGSVSAFSVHVVNGSLRIEGGWFKRPPQPPATPMPLGANMTNASLIIRVSDPTAQATERLSELDWPGNTSSAWEQHQFIARAPIQEKIRMMGIGGTAVWYIRGLFGW